MFAGGTPSGWHCASAPRIVAQRYTVALASPPDIRSCASELGTLVTWLMSDRAPACHPALVPFHFPCPVRSPGTDVLLMPGAMIGSIFLGGCGLAGAGGADRAGKSGHCFRAGKAAHRG